MIICMCGCMVQQEHMAEKIRKAIRSVDLVFRHACAVAIPAAAAPPDRKKRIFDISGDEPGDIAEGLPVLRDKG